MTRKKKPSAVFSVRVDADAIMRWRVYAGVAGLTVSELTEKAIDEYIAAHELAGFSGELFKQRDTSVETWVRDEVYKQINYFDKLHKYHLSDEIKDELAEELVPACLEGWGKIKELDDSAECEWMMESTINYIVEQAEKDVLRAAEYVAEHRE